MAAEHQHEDGQWGREHDHQQHAQSARHPEMTQPPGQDGCRHEQEIEKIQADVTAHPAGQSEEERESERSDDHRHRQEPFDPIVDDELIAFPQHVQRRIVADLIDHFRGGIQQDKQQQKHRGGEQLAIRGCGRGLFQDHNRDPQHE